MLGQLPIPCDLERRADARGRGHACPNGREQAQRLRRIRSGHALHNRSEPQRIAETTTIHKFRTVATTFWQHQRLSPV